jgi:hypothetical protein
MRSSDKAWEDFLNKASDLSFTPKWNLIFKEYPYRSYSRKLRMELKRQFYKQREITFKKILREKNRKIELKTYIINFLDYLKTDEGLDIQDSMNNRKKEFKILLSINNISDLRKDDLIDIIHYSWARLGIWSDYPYLSMQLLERYGLSKIKKELKELLYGVDSLEERFDKFNSNIKGLGGQYISEILAFTFPENCCIWNRVAADSSVFLGINNLLPSNVWKYRMELNGKNYIKCCEIMEIIKKELKSISSENVDFIDVYHFLIYIYTMIKSVLDEIRSITKEVK